MTGVQGIMLLDSFPSPPEGGLRRQDIIAYKLNPLSRGSFLCLYSISSHGSHLVVLVTCCSLGGTGCHPEGLGEISLHF